MSQSVKEWAAKAQELGGLVAAQKKVVASIKSSGSGDVKGAVAALQELLEQERKAVFEAQAPQRERQAVRDGVDQLCKTNFVFKPTAEIYGGVGGLYDYGPTGCAMKNNMLQLWRQHFVMEEDMLELECTSLTPEVVLKTSGHVERFTDLMVKDVKTGDCFRADKLLEGHVDELLSNFSLQHEERTKLSAIRGNAEAYSVEELGKQLKELDVKAPETGNELSDPYPFMMMFNTMIGPTGKLQGFLRPELAQGIFTNFRNLLEYNNGKMPFAGATIGSAFRNEISPRSGLLRVREFTLAEIEHFCEDGNKKHDKFASLKDTVMNFLPAKNQTGEDAIDTMTIGEAVGSGVVDNETLGYFMTRTQLFLLRCGIHADKLRFRQHKSDEMAHYAKDCWDAEIQLTYGWTECVGHADRDCYDLKVHSKKSKVAMEAHVTYSEPRMVDVLAAKLNKGIIGRAFRKDAKVVNEHLSQLSPEDGMAVQAALEADGKATITTCKGDFDVTKDMVSFQMKQEKRHGHTYTPSVVEPSFGIGRILYSCLEHAFSKPFPEDPARVVLRLSPAIAPYKASILPISSKPEFLAVANLIRKGFTQLAMPVRTDTSGVAIGRKYARSDEAGTPFAITIDMESVDDQCVTIRHRDSFQQVRVKAAEASDIVWRLCTARSTWQSVYDTYPRFENAVAQ